MARKFLFAVDFSPYTEKLIGCAGELAQAGIREVILLHVMDSKSTAEIGDEPVPALEAEKRQRESMLAELAAMLEEIGLKPKQIVKPGNPTMVILDTAKEEDVDLIFLGAQGKGFINRAILGSTSERVLKLADRPVMIQKCLVSGDKSGYTCENACSSLFGNILVANDFSRYAERVKPLLLDLAQTFCTPITLLHVEEGKKDGGYQVLDKARKAKARSKMEMLQEMSYELGNFCKSVKVDIVNGSAPSAILSYADEMDASLIVMGAFGSRGIIDDLLGEVTEKVIRKSDRPVLVLKA